MKDIKRREFIQMAAGAGIGALVGIASASVAVTTGAVTGGAGGGMAGIVGTSAHWRHTYNEAYAECRAH